MPKRIQPLTAKGLDAVRPRDGEVIELGDGLLPGLRVRVSVGGRFWSLNIRNAKGERRRFDVGDNLTLAEARRRAETLKQEIKQGSDPTGERREARQRSKNAKAGIGTFGSVIEAYFDREMGGRCGLRTSRSRVYDTCSTSTSIGRQSTSPCRTCNWQPTNTRVRLRQVVPSATSSLWRGGPRSAD